MWKKIFKLLEYLAGLGILYHILRFVIKAVRIGGDIDFVITRGDDLLIFFKALITNIDVLFSLIFIFIFFGLVYFVKKEGFGLFEKRTEGQEEPSLDDIRYGLTGAIKTIFETRMMEHENKGMSEKEAAKIVLKYIEDTSAGSLQLREIRRKYKKNKTTLPQEEKTKDFKIKTYEPKISPAFIMLETKRALDKRILEIYITFIPSQPMRFEKLFLSIDEAEIPPIESRLTDERHNKNIEDMKLLLLKQGLKNKLTSPYTIQGQETYKVKFQFESFRLNYDTNDKVRIVAIADGKTWKSKEFTLQV